MSNVNLYMKEILNHYCCSKNIPTSSQFQRSDSLFSRCDISLQTAHKTWKHACFSQHLLLEQCPLTSNLSNLCFSSHVHVFAQWSKIKTDQMWICPSQFKSFL